MAGNIALQILRGDENYDPTTSEEILLDGQLFYSKKIKQLYVGNGETLLKNLNGTQIGLNIESGEGLDSLIQKVSDENIDPTDVDENGKPNDFPNSATAESTVTFGKSNKNDGKRSIMGGKLNENSGANSSIVGLKNTNTANHAFQGGLKNTNSGLGSMQVGSTNSNTMDYTIQGGAGNTNTGVHAIQSGAGNKNDGDNVIQAGLSNTNGSKGDESFQIGAYNSNTSRYVLQWGFNNTNKNGYAGIGGKYNDNKDGTLFEIGNGKAARRSNAFEVYEDGRAKVYGAPTEDEDVLRLKDIQNIKTSLKEIGNIQSSINDIEDEIDTIWNQIDSVENNITDIEDEISTIGQQLDGKVSLSNGGISVTSVQTTNLRVGSSGSNISSFYKSGDIIYIS